MDILQIVVWALAGIIGLILILTAILTLTSWLKERSAKKIQSGENELPQSEVQDEGSTQEDSEKQNEEQNNN